MKVWIFCSFGWEMPVYALQIGVFGHFDPLDGEQCQCNPQKVHPCKEMHVHRQNRSTGGACVHD